VNLNMNATFVVDVDPARLETKASIRRDSGTIDTGNQRECAVNDNVHGGVQVQVHVKVDAI
jgi:hypothetical protein